MNAFLAEMYENRESIGSGNTDDIEKLAEAKILTDMLVAENIDLKTVPQDAIVKVAAELFGPDSVIVKKAAKGELPAAFMKGKDEKGAKCEKCDKAKGDCTCPKKEAEESDEEKVAQADMLGRIMAHSFHQESRLIKQAEAAPAPTAAAEPAPVEKTATNKLAEHLASLRGEKPVALAAPTVSTEKVAEAQTSAVDILARNRALEMLKQAGYNVDGTAAPTEEQKLAAAVDQRALQLLKDSGYPVE